MAPRRAIDDDCSLWSSQVNISWRLSDTTYTMDALVRSLSLPTLSDSSYCPKRRPGSRSALSHSSVHPLPPPPTNLWSFTTTGSGGSAYRRPASATARAQLTAASSKVSTPRSSYLLQIGVSCLICLGRNFLPISVFAFGLNTSDCEA